MRADWRSWSNQFSLQSNSENKKMIISIFVIPRSLLITQQAGPKFQLKRHLRHLLYDFDCKMNIVAPQESAKYSTKSATPSFPRVHKRNPERNGLKQLQGYFESSRPTDLVVLPVNPALHMHAGWCPFSVCGIFQDTNSTEQYF